MKTKLTPVTVYKLEHLDVDDVVLVATANSDAGPDLALDDSEVRFYCNPIHLDWAIKEFGVDPEPKQINGEKVIWVAGLMNKNSQMVEVSLVNDEPDILVIPDLRGQCYVVYLRTS